MPVVYTGPICARRGCRYPPWKDGLCGRCWRLGKMFGKDPRMFAYQPLDGYRDERDTVAFGWDQWQEEARARGVSLADLFAEPSGPGEMPPAEGGGP